MKKIHILLSALSLAAATPATLSAQNNFQLVEESMSNSDNTPAPVYPVPSDRQLKWNETEFYAFFHYGMNTYTNQEWGTGMERETVFAPTQKPDPKQWLEVAKKAHMKGGIAVVKHHDGFCLWPTATTEHCTRNSSGYGKDVDIPKDFADAARELNMKYGFYVSPWDLSSPYWGKKDSNGNYTDAYARLVFLPQCAEVAQSGEDQFEMWFDGATGGDYAGGYGSYTTSEKRTIDNSQTYYDIPNLRDSIHNLLPDVVMWGVGDEVRWIGNENGYSGQTCWSMGDGETGSEYAWMWAAGESDARSTKGWFWDSNLDNEVKTAETLFKMYLETVGRNATLLLNLPPNRAGLIDDSVAEQMEALGDLLDKRLGTDLAKSATVTADCTREAMGNGNYEARNLIDGNKDTYWATPDGIKKAVIELKWDTPQTVRYVSLMEYIKLGQRIKKFKIETSEDGVTFTKRGGNQATTTVGYKRIIPLNGSTAEYSTDGYTAKAIRITIENSRSCPLLHTIEVF